MNSDGSTATATTAQRPQVVVELEPQPGEVWVVTNAYYNAPGYARGHIYGAGLPFIVMAISANHIHCVAPGPDIEPATYTHRRHRWDWAEHAIRLWPQDPDWKLASQVTSQDVGQYDH